VAQPLKEKSVGRVHLERHFGSDADASDELPKACHAERRSALSLEDVWQLGFALERPQSA
jgi:hypothetical protein